MNFLFILWVVIWCIFPFNSCSIYTHWHPQQQHTHTIHVATTCCGWQLLIPFWDKDDCLDLVKRTCTDLIVGVLNVYISKLRCMELCSQQFFILLFSNTCLLSLIACCFMSIKLVYKLKLFIISYHAIIYLYQKFLSYRKIHVLEIS